MAKRLLIVSGLALLFLLLCGGASGEGPGPVGESTPSGQEFAPDQLLVRFRPSVARQRAAEILSERGAARIRRVSALGVDVLRLPPRLSVERAVEVFSRLPEVDFAEPNYILWAVAPSQTEIVDQWGLTRIRAPDAWPVISDKTPVLLAIVDTGIDRDHTDLLQNIWQNLGEINGSPGIDDDSNGYVDDTWGWDFHNNDSDPFDDNMHGTLVSSVAAAVKNENGAGVAGVCPWCSLAAVKVLGSDGSGYLDTVANGIIYAADIGSKVINLSLAGPVGAQTLEGAVDYAWGKGAVVVAAAGNDGADSRIYPAAYDKAMAVASTNEEDYRSCFSNYGEGYISVAAPGELILGAVPNQGYGTYSGTSLSAPHVSGLGGLLFSQDRARTNLDVRNIIETTVNDLGPPGIDAYFGTGRINAYRAVMGFYDPTDPPAGLFSDDLSASGYAHARKLARDANGTLHMTWHGRDGGQYRVLYSSFNDGGESWSQPHVVFSSGAETYHPALAIDGSNVYIAFPSKDGSSHYRVYFTHKPLSGGTWSSPVPLVGGSYHAVRPDLYVDPSNGKLHLVASSFDDRPYVYYTWSGNSGQSWSKVSEVNVDSTGGQKTRYADVHANGSNVYIAGRTVEFTFFGLIPRYRVFAIRSSDEGNTWDDLTELAVHDGWFSGEYGASLAGAGDRLYLAYEHAGAVYFRRSEGGAAWSGAQNVGSGAWPSVTQGSDGQAWVMWESGGNLSLRHYTGTAWDSAETVGGGNYPNLKLGTTGGFVEWVGAHCSGAPFRLIYGSRGLVANNPPVAEAGGPYSGDEGSPIAFNGSGSSDPDGTIVSYEWDFGDGATGTGANPTHTYADNGAYEATLTVIDDTGMTDTDTASVTVNNVAPIAEAGGAYSGEEGAEITLIGSASDPGADTFTYAWDLDNNGSYETTGKSVTKVWASDGTYTVGLQVTDDDGGVGTDTAVVDVPDTHPVAALSYSPASPVAESPVQFTDESISYDGITSWGWDFGDSNTSTEQNPTHAYASVGTYTVTLTVGEGDADSDTAQQSITVSASNQPPVADAGPDQIADEGATVNFDGSGSSDPDDTIVSYEWDFGDEATGDGVSASHVYADNGSYTIILTVTDDNGAPDTDEATVTIENVAPAVDAGSDQTVNEGDTVRFSGSFSDPGSGDTHTTEWDFGDGDTASGILTPSHAYTDNGEYLVTLTITDDDGGVGTDTALVTVNNVAPTAETGGPYSGIVLELITFTGSATDPGTDDTLTYSWDFGDESLTETGQTVSHTYSRPGTYTAILTVTDDDGGVGADTAVVTVNPGAAPTAYVSVEVTQQSFRRRWKATAVVTITETAAEGPPIRRATVEGIWSGVYRGDVSRTTNKRGKVSFGTRWITTSGEVCFSVLRVVKDGQEYELDGKTMDCISG